MKNLVLGGVKSGKSRFAEQLAGQLSAQLGLPVRLIVTARVLDVEMAERIARHQAQRSPHWTTIEAPVHLGLAIQQNAESGVILVDCLTLWLTNLLMAEDEALLQEELHALVQAVQQCDAPLVIVSNETNMGIVPLGAISRRYCDEIGMLHQRLALICSQVTLVVAGLPLPLKSGT